jgi:hypothetical protein
MITPPTMFSHVLDLLKALLAFVRVEGRLCSVITAYFDIGHVCASIHLRIIYFFLWDLFNIRRIVGAISIDCDGVRDQNVLCCDTDGMK